MLVDEDAIQAELREAATVGASAEAVALRLIVPVASMADEFPMRVTDVPRMAWHMADRTAAHVDQGKTSGWACQWDVVIEDSSSTRLRQVTDLVTEIYNGIGGAVGDCTIRVLVDRVSGTVYDPETNVRARVVTLMVLVQPAG